MRNAIVQDRSSGSFKENAEVRLRVPIFKDGIHFPAGTTGVIVWPYPDGQVFEVEFFSPQSAVVTVLGQDLI